jgi:hypothetical protein
MKADGQAFDMFSTSEIPRPLTDLFSGEENLSKH